MASHGFVRASVYLGYTMVFLLGGLALLPRFLWQRMRGVPYHRHLRERFGYGPMLRAASASPDGCLWFHAASVGEVQGLRPIVTALHERFPHLAVALSTFTPTGRAMAQRVIPEATAVFALPLDLPWIMRRVVRSLRPRMLIVQETELWPHLLRAVARQGVPVVLVNGRLSPRAFRRYTWVRCLMRRVLADATLLLVQSEESCQRFRQLGALAERTRVVGNTNIDRALLAAGAPVTDHPLTFLAQGKRLLIGGSTHEGEETVLLQVYQRLYQQHPDLLLVLAPRHLERVEAVVRLTQAHQCRALRRSQIDSTALGALRGPTAVIMDTLGELATLYRLGTAAFVGGSLVPIGGHNILEPAVFGTPLCFGPHMHHFPELAAMLCQAGGAKQVQGEAELYAYVEYILTHPEDGQSMGQKALQVLVSNRGALAQTVQALTDLLYQEYADLPAAQP